MIKNLFRSSTTYFENPNQDGSVLFELALVLPVILAVVFMGLEVARSVNGYQNISFLSREAGREAFNRCARNPDPATCIDQVSTEMNIAAAAVLPGAQAVITMYSGPAAALVGMGGLIKKGTTTKCSLADATGGTATCVTPINTKQQNYSSNFLARYNLSKSQFTTDFSPVITSMHPALVVAEIYYLERTILPVKRFLFINYDPGVLYETGIF